MKHLATLRALWHYRRGHWPCLSCQWTPGDTETRWHWVTCRRCDWGNQ